MMHQQRDQECPFCQIVAGAKSAACIYENNDALAFLPPSPAAIGHTLIIPKAHVRDLWHADMSTLVPITEATLVISKALRRAFDPDGLNLINSTGAAASQTIFHIHFHLVPRWDGDRIQDFWPHSEVLPLSETARIADEIRRNIEPRARY
jgi:histidine triad (HIT) family protein